MSVQADKDLNIQVIYAPCCLTVWLKTGTLNSEDETCSCLWFKVPSPGHGGVLLEWVCQTRDYMMKLNWGLLPAYSLNGNNGDRGTWYASQMLILFNWLISELGEAACLDWKLKLKRRVASCSTWLLHAISRISIPQPYRRHTANMWED